MRDKSCTALVHRFASHVGLNGPPTVEAKLDRHNIEHARLLNAHDGRWSSPAAADCIFQASQHADPAHTCAAPFRVSVGLNTHVWDDSRVLLRLGSLK